MVFRKLVDYKFVNWQITVRWQITSCKPVDYSKVVVYKCEVVDYSKVAVYTWKVLHFMFTAPILICILLACV